MSNCFFSAMWLTPLFSSEAFAVCENYSPPDGFNEKDLHRLLEQIGSPSGSDDLGNSFLCFSVAFFLC